MNYLVNIAILITLSAIASNTHAVVIISNDYIAKEGYHIEILHNEETQSGSVIAIEDECSDNCEPITLKYTESFRFSIRGVITNFDKNSPRIGKGDFSYKADDMSVGHINFSQ